MLPFWKTTFQISKNLRYTFTYSMCAYKTSREKDMVCDLCEKSQFSVPQNDFSQAIFVFFFLPTTLHMFFLQKMFQDTHKTQTCAFFKKKLSIFFWEYANVCHIFIDGRRQLQEDYHSSVVQTPHRASPKTATTTGLVRRQPQRHYNCNTKGPVLNSAT
jgi:uncharacterized protein YqhQ